jgi:hypothetical protein
LYALRGERKIVMQSKNMLHAKPDKHDAKKCTPVAG